MRRYMLLSRFRKTTPVMAAYDAKTLTTNPAAVLSRLLQPRAVLSAGALLLIAALLLLIGRHTQRTRAISLPNSRLNPSDKSTIQTQTVSPVHMPQAQDDTNKSSSVNVQLQTQSTRSTQSGNSSSADVTINGQHQHSDNGNLKEHYTSPDGSSTVNVSVKSDSQSGGSNMQ